MTPKEKAEELIRKYDCGGLTTFLGHDVKIISKQCALIAVDEIINSNPHSNPFNTEVYSTMDYWQEIKQEIEQL